MSIFGWWSFWTPMTSGQGLTLTQLGSGFGPWYFEGSNSWVGAGGGEEEGR